MVCIRPYQLINVQICFSDGEGGEPRAGTMPKPGDMSEGSKVVHAVSHKRTKECIQEKIEPFRRRRESQTVLMQADIRKQSRTNERMYVT